MESGLLNKRAAYMVLESFMYFLTMFSMSLMSASVVRPVLSQSQSSRRMALSVLTRSLIPDDPGHIDDSQVRFLECLSDRFTS